jgi:CSLREA domain-containing protein
MDTRPLCTALLALTALPAFAATWTVNDTGDAGDGTCDASCTLRDAVNAANTDDRILFDLALPAPIVIGLTGSALQIDVPLRITATDGVRTTLRRVAGSGRLMELTGNADARIIGLAFEDGGAPSAPGLVPDGGAIHVGSGTTLELRDCSFRNNVASAGSGAPNMPGLAARGGAIRSLGILLVENCAFVANRVTGGIGGPFGQTGGEASGGAIHADSSLTVLNSTFSANEARGGNGSSGTPESFPMIPAGQGGNGGLAEGGAISLGPTSVATIGFSTLIANAAVGGGFGVGGPGAPPGPPGLPGVARGGAVATAAPAIVDTSVVADHGAVGACFGSGLSARTSNRVDDASCPGVLVAALSSQFAAIDADAASPHYRPLEGSIVVDATADCLDALGVEAVVLDQLLTTRPLAGNGGAPACDFGAIELNPVLFADGFEEPPPPP